MLMPSTAFAQQALLQAADSTLSSEIGAAEANAPAISCSVKVGAAWQEAHIDGAYAQTDLESKGICGIKLAVAGDVDAHIQYQIHTIRAGWKPSAKDGAATSVSGSDRIDAIRVSLTGELSRRYDVSYRVFAQGTGWQEWVVDARTAGNTEHGTRLLALQVKLEKREVERATENAGILGVEYRVQSASGWSSGVKDYALAGTTGQNIRLTGFQIGIDPGAYDGSLQYRVHLLTSGWTKWRSSWKPIADKGSIDAIELRLTGEIAAAYDIVYRPHVSNVGWQRRMRNGETAGIAGSGLQIEAIRVKLEPKARRSGWVNEGFGWSYFTNGKKKMSSWLDTTEAPIDLQDCAKRRYWLDASGKLAVSRYINPAKARDAKAYPAYATEMGYLYCGKRMTSKGMTLSNNMGKLCTKAGWLKTAKYDGQAQCYRMERRGLCSYARTGFFKVGGKKYYAWPDERGYIMRSDTRWIVNKWYKANSRGVLANANNQTAKHIERYVAWAIRIAKDDSHGYSQYNRTGPDYDCSSLVCSSLIAAGFPDSGASWTGNMLECLTKIGFVWHEGTSGLKRGDILLVHADYRQHTEIYIGGGKLVGAHIAETGDIHGVTGDQTGNEISVTKYYNAPWQGFLRYRS